MTVKNIAVLVGSLREHSFNMMVAKTLQEMLPSGYKLNILFIGDLPLYNEDLDENPPKSWTNFRETLLKQDGVILITPEYNRSIPAVIKNALDVGSRPYGKNVFEKKPTAIISSSIGGIGGFGANHHLRQIAVFLDMPTMPQPEAYLSNIANSFNNKGEITSPELKQFLQKFIDAYIVWLKQNSK